MYLLITEGARRILLRSADVAVRHRARQIDPVHLLWSLVLEESRAAEILGGLGIDGPRLEELFPGTSASPPSAADRTNQTLQNSPSAAPAGEFPADSSLKIPDPDEAVFRPVNLEHTSHSDNGQPHSTEEGRQSEEQPAADTAPNQPVPWRNSLFARLLTADSGTASAPVTSQLHLPSGELLEAVLYEAHRETMRNSRQAELGSEQLLLALLLVPSAVSHVLESGGVSPDDLRQQATAASGIESSPIAVDSEFEIEWKSPGEQDLTSALRVLDAAANRLREGLRVVEDFVRFCRNDAHLSRQLKACRHDLQQILLPLEEHLAVSCRDTPGDVGTSISTGTELKRTGTEQVMRAGMQRVLESLRTLEEFGKIISPAMARQLEALRYRCYSLDRALKTLESSRQRLNGRMLYLLVSGAGDLTQLEQLVREAIAGGVDVIQLRDKQADDRTLLAAGKKIHEWTRPAGTLFIMNDRPDLAVLTQADGVHVGQEELSVRDVRRILGPAGLIGISTHSVEQARQAVLDGADYLGVGPTFPSGTKRFQEFPGLENIRQVAAEIALPWYAIGGIDASRLPQVLEAGATRVAVSAAVCQAEDPRSAARALRKVLSEKKLPEK